MTLVSGSGWEVGGTSWSATSETRATAPMMSSSCPAKWSSSSAFSSRRASRARWATSSRVMPGMQRSSGVSVCGFGPNPMGSAAARPRRSAAAASGASAAAPTRCSARRPCDRSTGPAASPAGSRRPRPQRRPRRHGHRGGRVRPSGRRRRVRGGRRLRGCQPRSPRARSHAVVSSRRHRGGDQPALHGVAAEVPQPLPGLVVLDALGDDQQAERVGEVDGAADDLRVLVVDGQPGHEGPVDLQLAHRQPPQVDQRGVARAEVVEGHLHAVPGQPGQRVGGPLRVLQQDVLGYLQLEGARRDAVPGEPRRRPLRRSRGCGRRAGRR